MRTVVVTGVTGTLGSALAAEYAARGWSVVGVTRRTGFTSPHCEDVVTCAQRDMGDARRLLEPDPDVVVLVAGQIEREVGEGGLPLPEETRALYEINAVFPSLVALAAAEAPRPRRLDVVAVGSIADGSPSCFGPVYHASKIALHYFYAGVAPIAYQRDPNLRLRVYRPGAIQGPLAWAPVVRLNERGRKVRARRVESAPPGARVARDLADWIAGDQWVGTWDEPLSFRALRLLFAVAPNATARLQRLGWRKASRYPA